MLHQILYLKRAEQVERKEAMSKPELTAVIKKEIETSGPIPFVRFMELALYHPEYGYYTSPGNKIGWKGDFYTSSTVHPVFGALIAKQLVQMGSLLNSLIEDKFFTIVEVGAGLGCLCHDILSALEKENPDFFHRIQYVIVEESPALKAAQHALLSPLFPGRLAWEDKIPSSLVGVVLSNELLDAFPTHRLRASAESLQEVYLDWKADQFVEFLSAPSTPRLAEYLDRLKLTFNRPVDLEVNLRALDWIETVGDALSKGFVITIDYGYPASELYAPHRRKGTFLCYHNHQVNENPYIRIGEQDMTAHVDFTSLADHGQKFGLKPVGFTDQIHFLMGLGIAERMEVFAANMDRSDAARREFLAMKQLMDPSGMGKTFKILIQEKGGLEDPKLDGLQFKPFLKLETA